MGLFGISGGLKKYSIEQAFFLGMFPMARGIYFRGLGMDRGFIKRIKSFSWRCFSLDGMGALSEGCYEPQMGLDCLQQFVEGSTIAGEASLAKTAGPIV